VTPNDPWQGNELDKALSGLETPEDSEKDIADVPVRIGDYQGRTEFPDLFDLEKEPSSGLRGGHDEKLAYFRRALKKAEVAIQRFREAWQVRSSEMDLLEEVAAGERERADGVYARNQALERFVSDKREEFDTYGKRIAEAFAEKEQIEAELRKAKKETEEHLARERREREQMAEELAQARLEHERTLRREREAHAEALREENRAQEEEVRAAKREHEARMKEERRRLEIRLTEERKLLETMVAGEREQQEIALRKERAALRATIERERHKFEETIKGHADDKAAAEHELAHTMLRLRETEFHAGTLRRELDGLRAGSLEEAGELRARLAQTERDLERQREVEAELRGEAAVVESQLLDRVDALKEELDRALRQAEEAGERQQRAAVDLRRDLDERDSSIRLLTTTLEQERRAQRDAELLHRERTLDFPVPARRKGIDMEQEGKLNRAVIFALKVVAAEADGLLGRDQRAEMFKRAHVALTVAADLLAKL
jgi:hypothetical protein